jgi:hypothetical protein
MRLVSTTFYGLAVFSMLALPSFGQGYGQPTGYSQPSGNPGYYYGPTPGAYPGYGTPPNPYPARGAQGYGYAPMPAGYGRQGPGPAAYAQAPMPSAQGSGMYAPAPMPYGQGNAPSGYGYARGDDGYVQPAPRGIRGEVAARAAQPTPGRMPMGASQPDINRNAPPSPTPPYPSVESVSPGSSGGEASASDRSGGSEKSTESASKDLWSDQCDRSDSCDSCDSCGACCRCSDLFTHRSGIFADFLYLRAFGVDMAHGIQENASQSGIGTAPAGDVGTLKPEFEPAFRVGFERACCGGCSSVRVAYTQYESNTTDVLLAAPGIGGTATPLTLATPLTAGTTFSELDATYGIDFRLADVEYSIMILDGPKGVLNWDIGARYGHLTQDFSQAALFAQPLGDQFVSSNITFDGGGLRTGLDGAWECGCSRICLYGKGFVNFLFGEFSSSYQQVNTTTTDVLATSHWVDSRVVPIIETEFGVSWTSCRGCLRLSAGYESSYWFNVIDTAEFIQAIQNRTFTNASQTIAFTGVVGRVEARW